MSDRVRALHLEVLGTPPALCAERALLVTRYFRRWSNRRKPIEVQKAEALASVLAGKRARIYPDELIVGCFTAHRVGGSLFPELHGVAMIEDLFRYESRAVNPLRVTRSDRLRLLVEVLPFWLTRFLVARIRPRRTALRIVREQLEPTLHFINEAAGIAHFVPDYEALVTRGTAGLRLEAEQRRARTTSGSEEEHFLRGVEIVCDGLDAFAERYRDEALVQARDAAFAARKRELEQIAEVCNRVPRGPARTLQEALQSILFVQIALNHESLDNAISPGRIDQILWPFYRDDIAAGRLDRAGALELLGCWAVKMNEIVPVFSNRITRVFGGVLNSQAVIVGGMDRDGADATNELTYVLLDLMDQIRTPQPNYQARIHSGSPAAYRRRIASALASGSASPALYNDDIIVPMMRDRGMSQRDARDYAPVGCVEPTVPGKSFLSTDAALFNLPLCLELAMEQGRRFGTTERIGAATPPAEACKSTEELFELLEAQVRFATRRLLDDMRLVEEANARFHPTPLTSMLIDGCVEGGRDASRGGARYNGSGIQGVGAVEVGDSLAAIEAVVVRDGAATMGEVVAACRSGFDGAIGLRARLRNAPKFGNDDPRADQYTARVMELFASALRGETNTRGGDYVPGFYSVTAHQAFGEVVGALPSGRPARAPFSAGITPASGLDRAGPTAALLSAASLPLVLAKNGVNFNLELAPWAVAGEAGRQTLQSLIDGAMTAGCMQMQVNVIDPAILIEARDNPGRYPGLLVRVSGYSAYFDDLSPATKQEIIDRTCYEIGDTRADR